MIEMINEDPTNISSKRNPVSCIRLEKIDGIRPPSDESRYMEVLGVKIFTSQLGLS